VFYWIFDLVCSGIFSLFSTVMRSQNRNNFIGKVKIDKELDHNNNNMMDKQDDDISSMQFYWHSS
jgi:hypothetical protein